MKYFLILCVLLFTACSTKISPDVIQNESLVLEEFWWKNYKNDTLNILITKALDENLQIKQGKLNITQSLLNVSLVNQDFYPTFGANSGLNFTKNLKNGVSNKNFSSDFTLSYELDLFGKLNEKYNSKVYEYEASKLDLLVLQKSIINKMIDVFLNLAYTNDAINLVKQSYLNEQKTLELIKYKYQHGKISQLELTEEENNLLNMQNEILEFKSKKAQILSDLKNILNINKMDLNLDKISLKNITSLHVSLDLPVLNLSSRADLKASEFRLKSSFSDFKFSEYSIYPSISIGASLSSNGERFEDGFKFSMFGSNIKINLPFLDYKRVKNNIKISKILYEKNKLDFEEKLTNALNEVNFLYKNYEIFLQKHENTKQSLQNSKQILQYQQDKYTLGRSDFLDYLNALNSHINLEEKLLSEKLNIFKIQSDIYKALGK